MQHTLQASEHAAAADELIAAIADAEAAIIATIERECEALRAGRMLAARALHLKLSDTARIYLDTTKAARACIGTLERVLPGSRDRLEDGRSAFSALLRVQLAVLAAERADAGEDAPETDPASDVERPQFDSVRRRRVMPAVRMPEIPQPGLGPQVFRRGAGV